MVLTLITTTEHPQTFLGLPSLSILHNPLHSPNFLFESTRINGIWCSLHKAVMSFLYCGSSQLSAKIAKTAWRLKNIVLFNKKAEQTETDRWIERSTYISRALHAWWIPRTKPLAIKAFFSTSCNAVLMSMVPPTTGAAGVSLQMEK